MAAGCVSGPPAARDRSSARPEALPGPPPAPGSVEPAVRLNAQVQGTVVFVNPGLRIVVMDFPIRRVAALGQRLGIYREDHKVGEVKVSGPIIETTVGGDVMSGEARLGDEVREE